MQNPKIENIRRKILDLGKFYKVRVYFSKNLEERGIARFWARSVTISSKQSSDKMLSIFFHELGHIHCWENSLWSGYHIDKPIFELSECEKRLILRTAVRAEKWIDKWARKEMAKHYPDLKYFATYDNQETIKKFKENIKEELWVV